MSAFVFLVPKTLRTDCLCTSGERSDLAENNRRNKALFRTCKKASRFIKVPSHEIFKFQQFNYKKLQIINAHDEQ